MCRDYITRAQDTVDRLVWYLSETLPPHFSRDAWRNVILEDYWPNVEPSQIKYMSRLCLTQLYILRRETDISSTEEILPFGHVDMKRYASWFVRPFDAEIVERMDVQQNQAYANITVRRYHLISYSAQLYEIYDEFLEICMVKLSFDSMWSRLTLCSKTVVTSLASTIFQDK